MLKNKSIGEAINIFVKLLEEEQKNGTLLENKKIKKEDEKLEGLDKMAAIVEKILSIICLGEEIKVEKDYNRKRISVYGNGLSVAIGKNGKNIMELEYIINLISKRKKIIDEDIILDIKDYRKKRLENIKKMAIRIGKKVAEEGKKITLKPMCSYERKLIHKVLSGFKDIKTESKSNEPYRRIVIYPVRDKR